MGCLLYPEDVDRRLSWPLGRAGRLARRRILPHVVLPDGAIRFEWPKVHALVRRLPATVRPEAGEVARG